MESLLVITESSCSTVNERQTENKMFELLYSVEDGVSVDVHEIQLHEHSYE